MPIKTYRPTTPTQRYKTANTFDQITTDEPHRPLLVAKRRTNGRNNHGRITVRHRGGGHRRHYRIIDFKRSKRDIPGVVSTIEYDPNRTCFIALIKYPDGEYRYHLATANMKVGQTVVAGDEVEIAEGNAMPLKRIPLGTMVHNIEYRVGKGGQVVRSAGTYAEVQSKENRLVQLKLSSGEIRSFSEKCYATIGQVSNPERMNMVMGSAGRRRWLGRRPHVRGVAMNPVDHPMGGGEGRSAGGGHPVSPWGKKAKGERTRRKNKISDKYIVRRRKK
jgi:large subunit ribosomal protein L2